MHSLSLPRRRHRWLGGLLVASAVAALLEGFARQLVGDSVGRLVIGLFMLALWLAYFLALGRHGEGADK